MPTASEASTHTVSDLFAAHLARLRVRCRATTAEKAEYLINSALLPWLGAGRPIDGVTRGEVQEWIYQPEQTRRPSHTRNIIGIGRAAYNLIARAYEWTERNPFEGVELPPSPVRDRVMTEEETRAMFEFLDNPDHGLRRACNGKIHGARLWALDAIRLLAYTGARRNEILYLDWSEVHLDDGVLVLAPDRHKTGRRTGREKYIYLSPVAVQFLRSMGPRESGRVFPCSFGTLRRTFLAMREEIGAPDLVMHDLRRSWSTMLGEAGIDSGDVAAVLGQTTLVQARHYRHLRPARLRELAGLAGELMGG